MKEEFTEIIEGMKLIKTLHEQADMSTSKDDRITALLLAFERAKSMHEKLLATDDRDYWEVALSFEDLKIHMAQLIRQTEEQGFW